MQAGTNAHTKQFLTLTHLPLVHDPDEGGAVLAEGGDAELHLQELVTQVLLHTAPQTNLNL